MTEYRPGGRRRIDRVLDPATFEALGTLSETDLRARWEDAQAEESDISYLRRLLHARIDIVRFEQWRRAAEPDIGDVGGIGDADPERALVDALADDEIVLP